MVTHREDVSVNEGTGERVEVVDTVRERESVLDEHWVEE